MIGRIAWFALLLATAMLATIAQTDRRSRYQGELAALVPPAYGGFAAEQRTRQALERGDGARALAEARRLVRHRPLPAEHLTMLALAQAMAGDAAAANSALEAAAARGWRDPLPQAASARAALAEGAQDIAAQRITALLATGELPGQSQALFAQLLTTADGRAAMARRYAAKGHWQANSLGRPAALAAPQDLARTIALALAQGAQLPCERLERLANDYARRGHGADAARFWPGNCAVGEGEPARH